VIRLPYEQLIEEMSDDLSAVLPTLEPERRRWLARLAG
jgi:hypothetical protein